ncbi:MAG: hypothetical protein COW01_15510 [Bdellovibrionales bacterium CG12_big_fil_rev_8_21_14_0_65_38_15]|nr:MAG: hypothetical protein COW79_14675 [Bdellovibrionales bacterium CG22_combo_CG10-13_8_21_14_all_38_13]PIQ52378.1 MAG: hypothetical protein COW01_15510 [Bdellovibrionales bacterium CG12_big_fil_rev_8_21_14_0_65_38_15]PIR30463.1 MAG: hypothetical protein COV38_06840 [Bdellovibrionales bacterium CG11_big_fil_rev_8_21_14_0_20_38_13]
MPFEPVIIFRHMEKKNWIISQHWKDLFFLNFVVDSAELRNLIPSYLELDTFEGQAFTSIVPFKMSKIRFPFTPTLPFSSLTELNLRTYVKYKGTPGIYFFTLDSNHRLGNFIANKFFHLPYCYSKIHLNTDQAYDCRAYNLELKAKILATKEKTALESFLVERYSLFTDNGTSIFRGQVIHDPWQLSQVSDIDFKETLHNQYNITQSTFHSCFYSKALDVYFKPFKKVGLINE